MTNRKIKVLSFVIGLVISANTFAAVVDINPRDIKGSQILLDRLPDQIEAEHVDVLVFQRKSSCNPEQQVGLFGLKTGLSFSQSLRQRYCDAVKVALADTPSFLVYNGQPLRKFASMKMIADRIPERSVTQTLSKLEPPVDAKRYTMLVDWFAAHMDDNSRYTHLVFELVLFDQQTKQLVWHSIISRYSTTDSQGNVAQAELVKDVIRMLSTIGQDVLMRRNSIDLKMVGASVLASELSSTAQLTLINDYYNSGYDTYGQSVAFYKLPDANVAPDKRIDAYPSLPPSTVGYFRLTIGHYALKAVGADHYKIEILEGQNQILKVTRGLLNRVSVSAVSEADAKVLLSKTRNAFFPDALKQDAILNKATWAND